MTGQEQELMERYIYQVVRRLPKGQRDEVGMELQELISDMMDEGLSMEAVLMKLGNPAEFAKQYQDEAHYLIGPEYYETYQWFVKIVLLCALIPIFIVNLIEGTASISQLVSSAVSWPETGGSVIGVAAQTVGKILADCIISGIAVFGGVTLVFAVMERQKIKLDLKEQKEWSVNDLGEPTRKAWTPQNLAPVPHEKAKIKRGDNVAGIVFFVIFSMLLIFAPHFFSAYFQENGTIVTIPILNLDQWSLLLPLLIVSLLIGMADDLVKVIVGYYNQTVMVVTVATGFLQIMMGVILLKVLPFWNPQFMTELAARLGDQGSGMQTLIRLWNNGLFGTGILLLICMGTFIEIGTTVYKTVRYGMDQ